MRKNILIFGHNYGTQFVDIYNQYTRLFDTKKYHVTVAYLSGAQDPEVRQRTLAEEVIFFDFPKHAIRYLKIKPIFKLLQLFRQRNFSIVICHRYKPSYITLWAAQFCRIPACIFVMHEFKTLRSLGRKLIIALLGRKNMLYAGVSNAIRDDLRKSLPFLSKKRVTTLYNMIDVELTEPHYLTPREARAQLGLDEKAFIFGNLGRLVSNKNQQRLIQAFAKIKQTCPLAKLVIMGDGELEHELKAYTKSLNLQNDVFFTGFIPQGFKYMAAFDCFILPSTQEAFGRVLLEAMLAKIPVIASRIHGIPEVVGQAGELINPYDIEDIAQAMAKIYHSDRSERVQQANNGYERIKTSFAIPCFLQQFWAQPLLAQNRDS